MEDINNLLLISFSDASDPGDSVRLSSLQMTQTLNLIAVYSDPSTNIAASCALY